MKNRILIAIVPVIACFALLPGTQAACIKGCDNSTFATALGEDALSSNSTGLGNSAAGWRSLFSNIDGSFNTGVGGGALNLNNGSSNTAVGAAAMLLNTIGTLNTAVGTDSLTFNDSGESNTALGAFTLFDNVDGVGNTAVGREALQLSTGDDNTAVGVGAGSLVTTASNTISIGSGGGNVDNACWIGHIREVTTVNNDAIPVVIDSAGQLGTVSSSARFKDDIKPMDTASEAVFGLTPVTFHYKSDSKRRPEYGLIAEEVAKIDPNLVVRNGAGQIFTVRYEAVNAMLLNEFLKEHKKVAQLQATVAQQQKGMEVLTAQLKEQAAQIQQVSAQLQVSKSAPQMVVNKP